jgi:SAM-dependent methyltransferase
VTWALLVMLWARAPRSRLQRRYHQRVHLDDATEMLAGGGFDTGGPAVWADLGCGDGTFTIALARLLAPGSTIYAIDRDADALRKVPAKSAGATIITRVADITAPPAGLGRLDGVLMANSLHFVRDQSACIERWSKAVAPIGSFLIVEYDTNKSSRWVPFPISRLRLPSLFEGVPHSRIRDLGARPSIYHRAPLYAAQILPAIRPRPSTTHVD